MSQAESTREVHELGNLSEMIAAHAAERPGDRAAVCGDDVLTWAELDDRVSRIANGLLALGVERGDKVAMLATTSLDYLATFLGTLRAGAVATPLSPMAAPETLQLMITDCDAKAFFLSQGMRNLVAPIEDELTHFLPGGRIAFDFAAPGWTDFTDWIGDASPAPPSVPITPDDGFNIIYSSGTTGVPKGILHNHRVRNGYILGVGNLAYGPQTVSLVSTPLYSNTTLTALLPTLGLGGCSVLMRKFDVAEFLALSQRERVTHAMLVPVQYQRILTHPDFDSYDLSSYIVKLSTSAPLRTEIKREVLDRWPGGLVEIYGMTEGGVACILLAHVYPDKLHTVGQPVPDCDMRIIDDEGRELPPGEIGEIVGRAGSMMDGYYKREELTADGYWYDAEGRRYQRSGDMGRMDADGFVQVLDRKKDMIISGGFNVYACDLEAVLLEHEAVADAAVVAIPSDEWGETPLGFVTLQPGAAAEAGDITAWANARLGKNQRLSGVEIVDTIPRSDIGKILKKELRAPYWHGRDSAVA